MNTNTTTVLKWIGLFTIVSAALSVAFNSFLPAWVKWKTDFPDPEEYDEPEQPEQQQTPFVAGGLTDVMGDSSFAQKEQAFEHETR